MAERRMFAKSIINSARFLRMPPSSRLLYYDLGMAADDDGVVEAFTVLRTTGAAEDDLRVLASKGFITVLNEDLVSHITDWRTNNLIKNDRYHQSRYRDLLVQLTDGTQMEPTGFQVGTQTEPEVRLGKVSIGQERKEESTAAAPPARPRFVPPTVEEIRAYCQERKNSVDPTRFVDYYLQQGWRLSNGNPMKDWKAAVRTWEHREFDGQGKKAPPETKPFVYDPGDTTGSL